MKKLKYTGERMFNHPGSTDYIVSLNRYKFSAKFTKNKSVLDISCGAGFGTEYLSRFSKKVVGVDVDPETIEYCRDAIKKKNTSFAIIDSDGKLNKNLVGKFDVIVSIETIEHVKDAKLFLVNLKKYLKSKSSMIILSTPNNYEKLHPSKNPFHTYEFDILELYKLIKKVFPEFNVDLYGQRPTSVHRNDKPTPPKVSPFSLVVKLMQFIWILDFEYVGIFRRIEHLGFYKKIGSFVRKGNDNFNVYKINSETNFLNPITSIYVIHSN